MASHKQRQESVSSKRQWSTVLNAAKVRIKVQLLHLAAWESLVISVSGLGGMVVEDNKTERKRSRG